MGGLRRGGRPRCCAALQGGPALQGTRGQCQGPSVPPAAWPCHLSLCHHQALLYTIKPSSSIPPRQSQGLSVWAEGLRGCQGEVFLSTLSHRLANAAPRLCLLHRPSTSVLAPLYPSFCPDNRSSSSSSSSWYPGGLCRQLPSLRSSLTLLRTGRRRHHHQLLSPPIPSPSLP